MERKWVGAIWYCDLCGRDLKTLDTWYDARHPIACSWGSFCHACFVKEGMRLGLGHGQRYVRNVAGEYVRESYK